MTSLRVQSHRTKLERLATAKEIDRLVAIQVRHFRRARGMTIQKLADGLGVTYQQVQKCETGTNRISAGRLALMAMLLGVEIQQLFESASESTPDTLGTEN